MKKRYQKPEVYFEDFELSTNIATACGVPTKTSHDGVCGITIPGVPGIVFISGPASQCTRGADGDYDICYHVPTDAQKLFNS